MTLDAIRSKTVFLVSLSVESERVKGECVNGFGWVWVAKAQPVLPEHAFARPAVPRVVRPAEQRH